jgi:hypothetical protein
MPVPETNRVRNPRRPTSEARPTKTDRVKEELNAAVDDIQDMFDPINHFTDAVNAGGTVGAVIAGAMWPMLVVAEATDLVTKPVQATGHIIKAAAVAVGLKD